MIKAPKRRRTRMMGVSHHFLLCMSISKSSRRNPGLFSSFAICLKPWSFESFIIKIGEGIVSQRLVDRYFSRSFADSYLDVSCLPYRLHAVVGQMEKIPESKRGVG